MIFNKAWYDRLKFVAQIGLPALGTFWLTVSGLFEWPNTEEVVGTIMALDFFLGTLLGLSTRAYNKSDEKFDGEFIMVEDENGDKAVGTFDLQRNPEALGSQKEVLFKVTQPGK